MRRSTNFTIQYWTVYVQHLAKILPIFRISRSTLRSGTNSRTTVSGLQLGLDKITMISKRMADNQSFQGRKIKWKALFDRTDAYKSCRTGNISMVKNYVAEWSSSNRDQDERSRVLGFHVVCWSLKSRSILQNLANKSGGCMEQTWTCRSAIHWARTSMYFCIIQAYSRSIFKNTWTGELQNLFWWEDHIHAYVQRHWTDEERQYGNVFAQCQRSGSICDTIQARKLVLPGARVGKYVVECEIPTNVKDTLIMSHSRWLTHSSVIFPTRYSQRQSHYRLDGWEKD